VNELSLNKLDIAAANDFLKMAAKEIKKKNVYLQPTKKVDGVIYRTTDLLRYLDINNANEVWDYILDLTKEDCVDVSIDYDFKRDTNTEVYEFKKTINGKLAYIKLTIRNRLICMSFHEDNYASLRR
jgi:hypothetical protein